MLKIHQIRNATIVIEWENQFILVDPMLAPKGKLPSLRYLTFNRRRNPLVDLPQKYEELKSKVSSVLITHCQKGHFDHLDNYGYSYLKKTQLPTYCAEKDKHFLEKRKVNAIAVKDGEENSFLGGKIETVAALHGRGLIGSLMEHGKGYFITFPGQPSLYVMGDTVLTPIIKDFIKNRQPDIIVAPAGAAKFDLGEEILMTPNELKELAHLGTGTILANHLEAIDHCRQTRASLSSFIEENGLRDKIKILDDGETFEK